MDVGDAATGGPRRTAILGPVTLQLSAAPKFRAGLPVPRNTGSLVVRQLFAAMGLDERRIFRWRIEQTDSGAGMDPIVPA